VVGVEHAGAGGEQREDGVGGVVVVVRVVEGRRGRDDHHPDVGHAVAQLAHGRGGGGRRRAPEARAQRGGGGGRRVRAGIEAEGEVVPAATRGGGGGDPVREGAGVGWEAPSRSHTYSPGEEISRCGGEI
jgi:hypothetical protein